jgi:replicative DNA helicase
MTDYDDPETIDRVPPSSVTAEQAVLGGMMMSKAAILDAVENLDGITDPFYRPAHDTIFTAIVTLYANGQPADPITVTDYLIKSGDIVKVGGAPYLHACTSAVVTAANTGYYAEIVRNLAMLRRVIETGTELVQMGYGGRTNPEQAAEVLDSAAAKLQALTASMGTSGGSREWTLSKVLASVMSNYDNPRGTGLPLPWRDMQQAAPMEPGNLVIFAGRPGMGKTNVALEIGRHAAIRHGRGVLIASMEMSHDEMGQRIIAAEAAVSLHKLRNYTLSPEERQRVNQAVSQIQAAPLRIDDTPAVPISKWRTRLRQLQADGELPAALIVDYLQIAKAETAAGANRTGEVDAIASGLKALAQEFQIVVIAGAQLNRSVEQRTDKVPTLADLRESGGIENNANLVILLNRPDYYEKLSPRAGEFDFIVAKNRMGNTCTITAAWRGWQARVVDMGSDAP